MEIEVGDRITFENGIVKFVYDTDRLYEINQYINGGGNQILKIERPNWEVVEEKKKLLTEEEREFLQLVLKFINTEIKCITKKLNNDELEIIFSEEEDGFGSGYWYYIKNDYFKNLEERDYTLKELRIGGINYEFYGFWNNSL